MERITKQWNLLTGVAVALCAVFGSFLALPPLLARDGGQWAHFGLFAVTLLVGLCLVPMHLYSERKALRGWFIAALVCSSLAITGFLAYMQTTDAWTFVYRDQVFAAAPDAELSDSAIGARRQLAESQGKHENEISIQEVLFQEGSILEDTWTQEGMRIREMRTHLLLDIYLVELLLLSGAVLTVVQAVYCSRRRPA